MIQPPYPWLPQDPTWREGAGAEGFANAEEQDPALRPRGFGQPQPAPGGGLGAGAPPLAMPVPLSPPPASPPPPLAAMPSFAAPPPLGQAPSLQAPPPMFQPQPLPTPAPMPPGGGGYGRAYAAPPPGGPGPAWGPFGPEAQAGQAPLDPRLRSQFGGVNALQVPEIHGPGFNDPGFALPEPELHDPNTPPQFQLLGDQQFALRDQGGALPRGDPFAAAQPPGGPGGDAGIPIPELQPQNQPDFGQPPGMGPAPEGPPGLAPRPSPQATGPGSGPPGVGPPAGFLGKPGGPFPQQRVFALPGGLGPQMMPRRPRPPQPPPGPMDPGKLFQVQQLEQAQDRLRQRPDLNPFQRQFALRQKEMQIRRLDPQGRYRRGSPLMNRSPIDQHVAQNVRFFPEYGKVIALDKKGQLHISDLKHRQQQPWNMEQLFSRVMVDPRTGHSFIQQPDGHLTHIPAAKRERDPAAEAAQKRQERLEDLEAKRRERAEEGLTRHREHMAGEYDKAWGLLHGKDDLGLGGEPKTHAQKHAEVQQYLQQKHGFLSPDPNAPRPPTPAPLPAPTATPAAPPYPVPRDYSPRSAPEERPAPRREPQPPMTMSPGEQGMMNVNPI